MRLISLGWMPRASNTSHKASWLTESKALLYYYRIFYNTKAQYYIMPLIEANYVLFMNE